MMGKNKYPAEENQDNKVGKNDENYTPSADVIDPVDLVFKENRTFELHVNRKLYRFVGRVALPFPRADLNHPDFTDEIKSLFLVKE